MRRSRSDSSFILHPSSFVFPLHPSNHPSAIIRAINEQELTLPSFPGVDYMEIDSLFSEEELMVRQTVRDFVDDEVLPIIEECNREEKFPQHLIPKMAEMGLFGATLNDYGLPGLNNVAYGLIMQELERGDSGLRSFASVQSGLVMFPINAYGSQEQKDYWIPKMAAGEKIGCFGLTEPDFGSNPGGMRTYARREGDE